MGGMMGGGEGGGGGGMMGGMMGGGGSDAPRGPAPSVPATDYMGGGGSPFQPGAMQGMDSAILRGVEHGSDPEASVGLTSDGIAPMPEEEQQSPLADILKLLGGG